MAENALISELKRRRNTNLPVSELFTGILHNRLGRVLTQTAGISAGGAVSDLSDEELRQAAHAAKALSVHLTEPMGMDSAQVTAGAFSRRNLMKRPWKAASFRGFTPAERS